MKEFVVNKFFQKKHVGILLYSTTLIFLIIQLFIPPYIGLANNGDFERNSQKVGIGYPYNAWSEENYQDSFFRYMIPTFQTGKSHKTGFFSTAEFTFSVAKLFNGWLNIHPGQFDVRFVGFVLFLIYAFSIGIIFQYISKYHLVFSIGVGLFACFYFTDILITQFFNTFYGEATGFVFFVFILAMSLLLLPKENATKQMPVVYLCVFAQMIALFMHAFAKFQYVLFLVPLLLLFAIQLMSHAETAKKTERTVFQNVVLLCCAACASVFVFFIVTKIYSRTTSNRVSVGNIILKDMLALSETPEIHLTAMGFSYDEIHKIKPNISLTLFNNTETYNFVLSDAGARFNRTNQIKIIAREPSVLLKLIKAKSKYLFAEDKMGTFQKGYGLPQFARDTRFSLMTQINNALFVKSFSFFAVTLLISTAISLFYIVKSKKWAHYTPYHILACLNIMCVLQFATVLLGDSSHDAVKHFFFVNALFILIFYATVCMLLYKVIVLIGKKINALRKEKSAIG